jgi:hypothetical protein
LDIPAEVILKILEELSYLRKEIESLKESRGVEENRERLRPIFHSLSQAKSLEEKQKEQKARLDPLLERAAEYAIRHFNIEPPKRTGGSKNE